MLRSKVINAMGNLDGSPNNAGLLFLQASAVTSSGKDLGQLMLPVANRSYASGPSPILFQWVDGETASQNTNPVACQRLAKEFEMLVKNPLVGCQAKPKNGDSNLEHGDITCEYP
ncbi:unnamed protein product [Echinostoma caproni]|uniref:Ig-like domain-containing protein n=1 Tax=Echinostoma caproni TaxID=27848 RepID=A0A183AG03_9TREM|nr:unnamed protein product [Echinostoma caproni]